MSLFVVYFGTSRKYENMAHHEIITCNRYNGLLEDIFDKKILAADFSLYLHCPTATDPSLTPDGYDCWKYDRQIRLIWDLGFGIWDCWLVWNIITKIAVKEKAIRNPKSAI